MGAVCQFLASSLLRYLLAEYCSPGDFTGHVRLYYWLFICLYYPSFIAMIAGICHSVKAMKDIEDAREQEKSIDMVVLLPGNVNGERKKFFL